MAPQMCHTKEMYKFTFVRTRFKIWCVASTQKVALAKHKMKLNLIAVLQNVYKSVDNMKYGFDLICV